MSFIIFSKGAHFVQIKFVTYVSANDVVSIRLKSYPNYVVQCNKHAKNVRIYVTFARSIQK